MSKEYKPRNQRDMIVSCLRGKFHAEVGNQDTFPIADFGVSFVPNHIRKISYKNRSTKIDPKTRNFRPIEITHVKNDLIGSTYISTAFDVKTRQVIPTAESGMFKVKFSDGSFMFFAQRTVGMGSIRNVETIGVGTKETLNKYYGYVNKENKRNSKPKVGLFKIHLDVMSNVVYTPLKDIGIIGKVFHQNKPDVLADVEQFFNNLPKYTRFGQPGSRRLLLVGEPGGGKTSTAKEIALEYSKDMCVVFATKIDAVIGHNLKVAKYNMPTLVILEDAESTIPWGNSDVLNYFDGINQPKTPKGCYMVLTTNFPQRIEPRVVKRPGRIDKIIKFGVLDELNTLKCIRHYFDGILFDSESTDSDIENTIKEMYKKVMGGGNIPMTGAQIKNLSESVISYSVSNSVEEITVDIVKKVREQLESDLTSIYDMATEESLSDTKPQPIGFGNQKEKEWEPNINWSDILANN